MRVTEGHDLVELGVDPHELRRAGMVRTEAGVALRVEGAAPRLRGPGVDRLVASWRRWDWQRFYMIGVEAGCSPRMEGRGWDLGDGWRLDPHLRCDYRPRDWAWAWSRTYGPAILSVYCRRSVAELTAWLGGLAPIGYAPESEGRYRLPAGLGRDGLLGLWPGGLSFSRSYQTPADAQVEIDAGMLGRVVAGDLGDVSWDLMDGDYVCWQATGEGLGSLREYLEMGKNEEELRERYRRLLRHEEVAADDAAGAEEVATMVLRHFGVRGEGEAGLVDWVRRAPVEELPRSVTVVMSKDRMSEDRAGFLKDVPGANRRILWRWQYGRIVYDWEREKCPS